MASTATEKLGEKLDTFTTKFGEIKLAHETSVEKIAAYEASVNDLTVKLDASNKRTDELADQIRFLLGKKYGSKDGNIPKDDWSWARFCFAKATNNWDAAPFEAGKIREFRDAMRVKAGMSGTDVVSGGALIPTQYVSELIELLRPSLIAQALGVTTLSGLTSSPVNWPKITGGSTAYWIAPEGKTITDSKVSTGQVELAPRKLAGLVKISNDLVLLSNPSVEAVVRADITATLAEAIDVALFRGLGSQGEPKGLVNQGVTELTDYVGAATDIARLNAIKDMIKTVANAKALKGNLAFATNVESWFAWDKLVDGNSRPYLQMFPADVQVGGILRGTISGFPVLSSPNVAVTSATPAVGNDMTYFGNWSDVLFAIWSAMEIASSTEADTAFATDELWIRAIMRVDLGVRHTESFVRQATSTQ